MLGQSLMEHISLFYVFIFCVHACDALYYLCCVRLPKYGVDTSVSGVNLNKNTTQKTCRNKLPNIACGSGNSLY
jgi:hypothetical protein